MHNFTPGKEISFGADCSKFFDKIRKKLKWNGGDQIDPLPCSSVKYLLIRRKASNKLNSHFTNSKILKSKTKEK